MINWHDIEDLEHEAEQLATMALTIDDAISYGPSSPEVYHGSVALLIELMHRHTRNINLIVANELKALRSQGVDEHSESQSRGDPET